MQCGSTDYRILTGLNMLNKLEDRFMPFSIDSLAFFICTITSRYM